MKLAKEKWVNERCEEVETNPERNIQQKSLPTCERPVSHASKVMLRILLNRLKSQAEIIIAEEQAGFRAGRSTTEQIFNLRIL